MVAVQDPRRVVFSLGHSNHSPAAFLALLSRHGITAVVDTRSQPYSQYSPQFNHAALSPLLEGEGIEYIFAGDTLGGRPNGAGFYDRDGRVLYYKVADSDFFALGVSRLKFLAEEFERVALLCSEEDPTQCHRRLLVARVLADEGIDVMHIRADGRLQSESDLAGRQKVSSMAQPGLFDAAEESSWKSTRSVLPARPRSASSSH
jgi:uncharacterized protein (DUF488 family)